MKQQQEQQMTIRKGGTQIIQVHQYSLQIPVQGPAERPEGALTCNEKGIKRMYGMIMQYDICIYLQHKQAKEEDGNPGSGHTSLKDFRSV